MEAQSRLTLCERAAHRAPLSLGFSRQERWSGLPFPPLADLPHPGVQLASPASLALAGRFFTAAATGKPPRGRGYVYMCIVKTDLCCCMAETNTTL